MRDGSEDADAFGGIVEFIKPEDSKEIGDQVRGERRSPVSRIEHPDLGNS